MPTGTASMQITLLPPLLPTEGVTSVPTAGPTFAPGMKVVATVLATNADGGTLLSLFGHRLPVGSALPYPAGTTLRLEVVEGGSHPLLRLVGADQVAEASGETPAAPLPPPPVSAVTYALAAAVLAAGESGHVRDATAGVARWMPALVAAGLLTEQQAGLLLRALGPVVVAQPGPTGTREATQATKLLARAIATRVTEGGLMLERRLGDVVRQASSEAERAAAGDVRARLAAVSHVLEGAPTALDPARAAVTVLQQALLAEQARAAAHLASEGVLDVRLPLQLAGHESEVQLRLRIDRDAPDGDDADPAPWRHVRLDLALDGLGHVQVRLGVVAARVRAEFVVERADTADRIEAGLADLAVGLEAAGFAQVLSRVVVDPVRACAPDDLPELPPQHTILDTRA